MKFEVVSPLAWWRRRRDRRESRVLLALAAKAPGAASTLVDAFSDDPLPPRVAAAVAVAALVEAAAARADAAALRRDVDALAALLVEMDRRAAAATQAAADARGESREAFALVRLVAHRRRDDLDAGDAWRRGGKA